MKLGPFHTKVLAFLSESYSPDGMGFYTFKGISAETGIDAGQVRRSCRFLARKGLTKYGRGLWTEDGEPFGSGYAATKEGHDLAETRPRKCEGCFQHMADPPSHLCPGCQAYREHQA